MIGVIASFWLFGLLYGANQFSKLSPSQLGSYSPHLVAGGIHILSWIFQICKFLTISFSYSTVGHQVFEKRAPAFTKDPIQALVLAPLFVFCESLFALGFFPKTAARLEKKVQDKVKLFKASKAQKSK